MIIGSITITSLDPISNAVANDTLIPVVNMSGVPTTQKMTVANLLQSGLGANLGPIANVKIEGGTNGYVLQTDGTGNLTWTNQSGAGNGSVGGANTQVQFNDAGNFGGNAGFTFNKTAGALASPMIDTAAVYHLAGTVVENADLTHGATSALIIPENGNTTNPAQLNNFYGNVVVQSGTDADHTTSWTFDNTGNLVLPTNASSINYANGQPYGGTNTGNITFSNTTIGTAQYSQTINIATSTAHGDDNQIQVLNKSVNIYAFDTDANSFAQVVVDDNDITNPNVAINLRAQGVNKNWTFDSTGALNFPDNSGQGWPINKQRFGMGNIAAWLDGEWTIGEYAGNVGGATGIRIDPAIEGPVGMTFPSTTNASTQPVTIYSTAGSGIYLLTGSNNWNFGSNGVITNPNSVYENSTSTVTCGPGGPTVILSSINSSIHTMKLIIQIEGRETSLDYDTQACEMLVVRSFRNNSVVGSVYGLTYTSNSPLATFNAAYNATTNMIDVTCTPTSAQEPVYVRLTATQITTSN